MHRSVRNLFVVVLAALGLMTVTAGAASAKTACSNNNAHALCFSINKVASDTFAVHVGIDVKMSRADADAIINQNGDPFDAWAMGDDPVWNNAEFRIHLTRVWSTDAGLSAEFDVRVPGAALNEDPDGGDELFARVRLFDQRTSTRTFNSRNISSPF